MTQQVLDLESDVEAGAGVSVLGPKSHSGAIVLTTTQRVTGLCISGFSNNNDYNLRSTNTCRR